MRMPRLAAQPNVHGADVLRAVVAADRFGFATLFDNPVQRFYNAFGL
jgi:hypothetical protein